jgi:cyanophycin synthetase
VLASLYGERILIECWTAGESYRLLFLDGEMIHASRRKGRRVVGDGQSTVRELLAKEPQSLSARPVSRQTRRDIAATLEAQNLTLESVPAAGRRVVVESARNRPATHTEVRTVFDEDATSEIGAALREEAARAVRVLGSRFAGVDVITVDPSLPLGRSGGVINEINSTPGLHHHAKLDGVHGNPPAVRVLDRLLGSTDSNLGGIADVP